MYGLVYQGVRMLSPALEDCRIVSGIFVRERDKGGGCHFPGLEISKDILSVQQVQIAYALIRADRFPSRPQIQRIVNFRSVLFPKKLEFHLASC